MRAGTRIVKHNTPVDVWRTGSCNAQSAKTIRAFDGSAVMALCYEPRKVGRDLQVGLLLYIKKVGQFQSARVDLHYRASQSTPATILVWFWIGSHADYEKLDAYGDR